MQLLATTVAAALIASAAGAASVSFVDYGKGPDFRGQVPHAESLGLFLGVLRHDDPRRSAGAAGGFGFGGGAALPVGGPSGGTGGAALPGGGPSGGAGGAALPGGGTAGGEPLFQPEPEPSPVFAAGPNPPAMSAGLITENRVPSPAGLGVSSVPLPAGLPLMVAALGALALMQRVRRS